MAAAAAHTTNYPFSSTFMSEDDFNKPLKTTKLECIRCKARFKVRGRGKSMNKIDVIRCQYCGSKTIDLSDENAVKQARIEEAGIPVFKALADTSIGKHFGWDKQVQGQEEI